jgi:hypothetical protein
MIPVKFPADPQAEPRTRRAFQTVQLYFNGLVESGILVLGQTNPQAGPGAGMLGLIFYGTVDPTLSNTPAAVVGDLYFNDVTGTLWALQY